MLKSNLLEKCLGSFFTTFCVWFFTTNVSRVIFYLLTRLYCDWLYLLRYWAICVLKLLVSQVVTSYILKLTLSFYVIKKSRQNLNILRTKTAFKVKSFWPFLKSFQLPEIVLNLRVHLKWRCKKAKGAKELSN